MRQIEESDFVRNARKFLEMFFCFILALVYWLTVLGFIVYKDWNWKWIFFGTFTSFLMYGFYKTTPINVLVPDDYNEHPKDNLDEAIEDGKRERKSRSKRGKV